MISVCTQVPISPPQPFNCHFCRAAGVWKCPKSLDEKQEEALEFITIEYSSSQIPAVKTQVTPWDLHQRSQIGQTRLLQAQQRRAGTMLLQDQSLAGGAAPRSTNQSRVPCHRVWKAAGTHRHTLKTFPLGSAGNEQLVTRHKLL